MNRHSSQRNGNSYSTETAEAMRIKCVADTVDDCSRTSTSVKKHIIERTCST